MKKTLPIILLFFLSPLLSFGVISVSPSIVVTPASVIQGEPIMITFSGLKTVTSIKKVTLDGQTLNVFVYQGKPTALFGFDLKKKVGDYKIVAMLIDGSKIEKIVSLGQRPKIEAPLGIPEKLGGNTPVAEKNLIDYLSLENRILGRLKTGTKSFWTEKFTYPLQKPFVTDAYGYLRQTGASTINHKGTDFRAPEGTQVFAMNRGVVRLAKEFHVYGNTVVVDHGLGLMTFYMHLSKIKVEEGKLVTPSEVIGLSGQTGYAESPHLHLSVRIGGISIDPMKFMTLFK